MDEVKNCPPCPIVVKRACVAGTHGLYERVCSTDPVFACEKSCGNPLLCGNHFCVLGCHDRKAVACKQCPFKCAFTHPCGHPCVLDCHPKDVAHPVCVVPIRFRCYCTGTEFFIPCWQSKNNDNVHRKRQVRDREEEREILFYFFKNSSFFCSP